MDRRRHCLSDRTGEVRTFGETSSDLVATERALRKIKGGHGVLHVAYEAGPTGVVFYCRLQQLDLECIVVAPSRTPQPRGGRQKTNRGDALQLARLHRAGALTSIRWMGRIMDGELRDEGGVESCVLRERAAKAGNRSKCSRIPLRVGRNRKGGNDETLTCSARSRIQL